jgi:hypothetical protein
LYVSIPPWTTKITPIFLLTSTCPHDNENRNSETLSKRIKCLFLFFRRIIDPFLKLKNIKISLHKAKSIGQRAWRENRELYALCPLLYAVSNNQQKVSKNCLPKKIQKS